MHYTWFRGAIRQRRKGTAQIMLYFYLMHCSEMKELRSMTRRCLTDISGPFYDPTKPFRNWSALPFYQLDLPQMPFVDQSQLARGLARAGAYLEQIHAQGYTGIVIDNLPHLVGFETAPIEVYPANSPYRLRAAIYRQAFGPLFEEAVQRGMEVFVTTDMQWSTPPVRRFARRMTAHNPRLAEINRWAVEELFTLLPQVRGLIVRVGETGGAHNQGQSYMGHMLYTTTDSLRSLIATLLPVCEAYDRLLIIRTWSIGIGELGDLLWSPTRYGVTFADYTSPHLLVSIKHGPSDFFRHLPHNPTLGLPGPAQIIEMQNRREYELFGMVPSSIGELHQSVVQHAEATNRQFAGVWAWNGTGGWGGGRAALGSNGWSLWTELNSALTAALVHNPDLDTSAFVSRWCEAYFGGPFGAAVADLYRDSAQVIAQSWYPGRLTHGQRTLGAIYLPPLLWIWWMRPTASLVIWAYLATAIADRETLLREDAAAVECLAGHAERLARLAPAADAHAAGVVESAYYFHDLLNVARQIRALMLRMFAAAWSSRHADWQAVIATTPDVRQVIAQHQAAWAGNTDLPPLEGEEIATFLHSLERHPKMFWARARLACMLVDRLQTRQRRGRQRHPGRMIAMAVLVCMLFYEDRPRAGIAGAVASLLFIPPLRQRAVRLLLPWLNRRFNLLPSIFFEAGPAVTEWTV